MKKYLAEFIGTFALVFCGTGSVIVNEQSGGSLGLIGISLTFGIIIMAMIYIFGSTSGTHINPAVTIALAIGKLMPKNEVIGYVLSQTFGALCASGLLFLIFPETTTFGETLPTQGVVSSFVLELVLTFFLMLTILGITSKKEHAHLAGITIGAMVTGIILLAGPISGGSFNPARSLAPALFSGNTSYLWVYLTAPTLGAIAATLLWKNIFSF